MLKKNTTTEYTAPRVEVLEIVVEQPVFAGSEGGDFNIPGYGDGNEF